jgi:hypothetical protein
MRDRYGPLLGVDHLPIPADAAPFATEQARKAAVIAATDEADPRAAPLARDKEADRHDQVGRLALYLAGYHTAYGDPAEAEPMEQLGNAHLGLAGDLRRQLPEGWIRQADDGERALVWFDGVPDEMASFVPAEERAAHAAERAASTLHPDHTD